VTGLMHSVQALTRAQKMHLFQLVQLVKMKMLLFVFKERVNQVSTSESISGNLSPGNPLSSDDASQAQEFHANCTALKPFILN